MASQTGDAVRTARPFGVVTVSVSSSGNRVRIGIGGEIDLKNGHFLEQCVRDARNGVLDVTLDLSRVTFMGSAGIHALVGLLDDARANGWELEFTDDLKPEVERVLKLTGVLGMMRMVDPVAVA